MFEPTSTHPRVSEWLVHVSALAVEIGPRGPTRPEECQGAEYAQKPLENTRIYAVITGCEEVQHYGAIDFFKRHRVELKEPKALIFEILGCAGPACTTREGIIVPFQSDPGLCEIAERLRREHPDLQAYTAKISGGNSELSDAVRFKVPAITMFGLKPDGEAPYWHQR